MVRGTFSPARAWRPAVVTRLARTLGLRTTTHACHRTSGDPALQATPFTVQGFLLRLQKSPGEVQLFDAGIPSHQNVRRHKRHCGAAPAFEAVRGGPQTLQAQRPRKPTRQCTLRHSVRRRLPTELRATGYRLQWNRQIRQLLRWVLMRLARTQEENRWRRRQVCLHST